MTRKKAAPKAAPRAQPDYRARYNAYWSREDRIGESSGDVEDVAQQIIDSCGIGSVLDTGCGEGALVAALLRHGVDAQGLDVSDVVVARCNERIPGRFIQGSILSLPFDQESFDTLVSVDCLEHLAPGDVPRALQEMHRVARSAVFLKIATTPDRDAQWHLSIQGRAWWETRCFEAGFRKHPAYYWINDYESLNSDPREIIVLLEKIPAAAREQYPLASLAKERGLHMDMLRDSGERSDAHVIRYQWACRYIRPGDRVLDAACGLGYGARVIQRLTLAESVLGIDGSEFAIDYATKSFAGPGGSVAYKLGLLPEVLASFPEGSFDAIVSFETLEHVAQPEALLREFNRLLTPGGRLLVSVPNDWSDETGEDPNPYHLHVYDWTRLKRELAGHFLLEEAFAQTASQCKVRARGNTWERQMRSLRKEDLRSEIPADCEWWLMAAMKSPLDASRPYRERVFRNVAASGHPSLDYEGAFKNPWLMHAMVNVTYRMRDSVELARIAAGVLEGSASDSNDYAAALCVTAYRALERQPMDAAQTAELIAKVDAVVMNPPRGPMGLRWKVSLLFVRARLLQEMGRLEEARRSFEECGRLDVRPFGIHLATKATGAWFLAGRIAHALGDLAGARDCWERGVGVGETLLSVSLDDILINRAFPNRFNYGDGVREYTLSWDNIARCANGLHLLASGAPMDDSALESSFQTEYSTVARALLESRHHLTGITDDVVEVRRLVSDRTAQLEVAARDLESRTRELVETRATAVERTGLLARAGEELRDRTQELVETRAVLTERTRLLEAAMKGMPHAAQELVEARELLTERTGRLEAASKHLKERTGELVELRKVIADRTGQLEIASNDLQKRTGEMVETRGMLGERTRKLELVTADLASLTQELVETRETVGDLSRNLETTNQALQHQSRELVEARELLAGRTSRLESASKELDERTRELVENRGILGERTRKLELVTADLASMTQELVETRETLGDLSRNLESTNEDLQHRSRELAEVRASLSERTAELEGVRRLVRERTRELEDRTDQFRVVSLDLGKRMQELQGTRETLGERTGQFQAASLDLRQRTQELQSTREVLAERAHDLEVVNANLADTEQLLRDARSNLDEIHRTPIAFAFRTTFRKIFGK